MSEIIIAAVMTKYLGKYVAAAPPLGGVIIGLVALTVIISVALAIYKHNSRQIGD